MSSLVLDQNQSLSPKSPKVKRKGYWTGTDSIILIAPHHPPNLSSPEAPGVRLGFKLCEGGLDPVLLVLGRVQDGELIPGSQNNQ